MCIRDRHNTMRQTLRSIIIASLWSFVRQDKLSPSLFRILHNPVSTYAPFSCKSIRFYRGLSDFTCTFLSFWMSFFALSDRILFQSVPIPDAIRNFFNIHRTGCSTMFHIRPRHSLRLTDVRIVQSPSLSDRSAFSLRQH